MIPKRDVDGYRDGLHVLGSQAANYVRYVLEAEPSAVVAQARDAAIAAIMDAVDAYGDMAQEMAATLYDEVCALEGIASEPARIFDGVIDEHACIEKVHYYARDLVMGAREKFDQETAGLAEFYVRRCAYENTVRNCDENNVRYARVPTGLETCAFCFMLASRGFVYHTEATASGEHGMHRDCDCIIIPGIKGKTKIEGYDEDGMRDRWGILVGEVVPDGESQHKYLSKLINAASKRGPDWMWRGI